MAERIKARIGLLRTILGSGRTSVWEAADKEFHAGHKTCEMCGCPAGSLGGMYDGAPGNQCMLEAHDVVPYHTLTDAQKNDYDFILKNFIMLHRLEHHRVAHAGDKTCQLYNPNIRIMAAYILLQKKNARS